MLENVDEEEILTEIQVRREKHLFLNCCPREKEYTYLYWCVCNFISEKQIEAISMGLRIIIIDEQERLKNQIT